MRSNELCDIAVIVQIVSTFVQNYSRLKRNYDSIAWFYDRLSRLVYGQTLVKAQQFLVKDIPTDSRVLIVGGGTGWVLEEIAKIHSTGLTITYIDASPKMIAIARKRNLGDNSITFIAATIEAIDTTEVYDVVLTPFLFDNFTESGMRKVFVQLDKNLAPQGRWLFCDFQKTDIFWQKLLLKVMYFFFSVSCGIEASALPGTEICFSEHEYKIRTQKMFLDGFVASTIFEKQQ